MDLQLGVSDNYTAISTVKRIHENTAIAQQAMKQAQERYAKYANKGKTDKTFVVGDQVMISTKYLVPENIAARPSKKLSQKFMSPFEVTQVISSISYKLKLPKHIPVHPVIHVSQLKSYTPPSKMLPNFNLPAPEIIEGNEEYEVEKIVDKRIHYCRTEYLVK